MIIETTKIEDNVINVRKEVSTSITFRGNERKIFGPYSFFSGSEFQDIVNGKAYPFVYRDQNCTVLDIGANIGVATLFFAANYKEVHSYEPSLENIHYLEKNVEGVRNVYIHKYGICGSGEERKAKLFVGKEGGGHSSMIHPAQVKGEIEEIEIKSILEEISVQEPQIVKIDTGGMEVDILNGIFSREWPKDLQVFVFYIEFYSENDRKKIDEILSETHSLVFANIQFPHRGTLCYMVKEKVPENLNKMEIKY